MRSSSNFLAAVALIASSSFLIHSAQAQVSESGHSSSSSTTMEASVKGFAFKYKEKFKDYDEEIAKGIDKGWLTPAQADTFKSRLAELRQVDSTAAKANYPDDQVATLDKMTTKFNEDISTAATPKPAGTTGSTTKTTTVKKTK